MLQIHSPGFSDSVFQLVVDVFDPFIVYEDQSPLRFPPVCFIELRAGSTEAIDHYSGTLEFPPEYLFHPGGVEQTRNDANFVHSGMPGVRENIFRFLDCAGTVLQCFNVARAYASPAQYHLAASCFGMVQALGQYGPGNVSPEANELLTETAAMELRSIAASIVGIATQDENRIDLSWFIDIDQRITGKPQQ